jgi:hypothetical protein
MAETPRFEWLAEQFGALALSLGKTTNSDQRKDLLKRMRVLIDEVDDLILEEYLLLNRARVGPSPAAPTQTGPTGHAGNSNSNSG